MIDEIVSKHDMLFFSKSAEIRSPFKVLNYLVAKFNGQMLCLLNPTSDIKLTVSVSNWSSSSLSPTNSYSVLFTTSKSGVSKLVISITRF